jgi:uncharacterized heparinase superfamily protein
MLSWLNAVTFTGGDIPLVNDAAAGVAPTTETLNNYAKKLPVTYAQLPLGKSGYRMFKSKKFELFTDIGAVGPAYQPGHAHADTFNFILYANNRPIITDTGTSTYREGAIRSYERSTAAHNTVEISQKNSSNVWASHRVAQKAKVTIVKDMATVVEASHNGYKKIGQSHTRTFEFQLEYIKITDKAASEGIAYFHFHPAQNIINTANNQFTGADIVLKFAGECRSEWMNTHYALEFNKTMPSKTLCIYFNKYLETYIQ